MTNRDNISVRRIGLLSILLFTLFLFGCSAALDGSPTEGKTSQPVLAQAIAAGNVKNGQDLFMGYQHFKNDGPVCMGCHSVGENGLLGGGVMGPDLTDVSKRRSQLELVATLSNSTATLSAVMEPIYAEHPLTASEQADLIAFLTASVGQPESDKELLILSISLAGVLGCIGAIQFIYRKRLRGVRRPLVKEHTL